MRLDAAKIRAYMDAVARGEREPKAGFVVRDGQLIITGIYKAAALQEFGIDDEPGTDT
jgi:hypothetical protein